MYPRNDVPLTAIELQALPQDADKQFPKDAILLRDSLFNVNAPDFVDADQVIHYAEALYLSKDGAWTWLRRPCPALAARPIDLLATAVGCEQVLRVLYAKYHSVYL